MLHQLAALLLHFALQLIIAVELLGLEQAELNHRVLDDFLLGGAKLSLLAKLGTCQGVEQANQLIWFCVRRKGEGLRL